MSTIMHFWLLLWIALAGTSSLADGDDDDGHESRGREKTTKPSIGAVADLTYRAECASCHMLYPPGLLPARSWKNIIDGLKDHFGDNATVDATTKKHLTDFLISNAADSSPLKRSQKIARSIPTNDSPLRFTETHYFKRQHHEIAAKVWKRKSIGSPSNCAACHGRAESGVFSEDEVRIPR